MILPQRLFTVLAALALHHHRRAANFKIGARCLRNAQHFCRIRWRIVAAYFVVPRLREFEPRL